MNKKFEISVDDLESSRQPPWEMSSRNALVVHMMADVRDGTERYAVDVTRKSFDDGTGDQRLKVGDYWYAIGDMAYRLYDNNEVEPVDPSMFVIVP